MLVSTACRLRVGAARRLLSKRPTPLSAASPGGSASATPRHCTGPSAPGLAQPRSCTASTSAASRPDPAATIRTSDPPRDSSALAYVAAIARACRQCRCRRRLGTGAPRTPRAGRRTRRRRDQPRCPAPPYRRVGPDLTSCSPQRYPAVNTPEREAGQHQRSGDEGRRHPGRRRCRYARFLVRLPQIDMAHHAADRFLERSKNA